MIRKGLLIITIVSAVLSTTAVVGAAPSVGGPVFNDAIGTVHWTTPATCRSGAVTPCNFLLYVNEPSPPNKQRATVGSLQAGVGTTLTINYPSNFCGTIQADVFFQVYGHTGSSYFSWAGKSWVYAVVESNAVDRHKVSSCGGPT